MGLHAGQFGDNVWIPGYVKKSTVTSESESGCTRTVLEGEVLFESKSLGVQRHEYYMLHLLIHLEC